MGPLATVDFLRKLVAATPARCDQDHIPMIVRFCPDVPDRAEALAGAGPSPEAALVEAAVELSRAGAQALAIACNTAHYWHDAIQAAVPMPILHIVDAVVTQLRARRLGGTVGLLATSGTLRAGIYPRRAPDVHWIEPTADELERLVMPGIRAIKAQRLEEGGELLTLAGRALVARGAHAVLMGCTEVPVALDAGGAAQERIGAVLLDATAALAQACVRWAAATPARDSAVESP